jgi:hypothetical protein
MITGRSWSRRGSLLLVLLSGLVGVAIAGLVAHTQETGGGSPPASTARRMPGPAGVETSPPRLLLGGRPAALVVDPTDPSYDPSKFLQVLPLRDLFAQGPRAVPWAAVMERYLTSAITRDLSHLPGPPVVEVACRSTTCRFAWTADRESYPHISRLIRFLYIGSGSGPGHAENDWIVVYKGGRMEGVDVTDAQALLRALDAKRATQLRAAHARAARGRPLRGLELAILPKEVS